MWNRITNRISIGYSIPLLFLLALSVLVRNYTAKAFKFQGDAKRTDQNIRDTDAMMDGINRISVSIRSYATLETGPGELVCTC